MAVVAVVVILMNLATIVMGSGKGVLGAAVGKVAVVKEVVVVATH